MNTPIYLFMRSFREFSGTSLQGTLACDPDPGTFPEGNNSHPGTGSAITPPENEQFPESINR